MNDFAHLLRNLAGTLFLLPVLALAFGSHYDFEGPEPETIRSGVLGRINHAMREVELAFVPEGVDLREGIALQPGEHLIVELGQSRHSFVIELQADANHAYKIKAYDPEGELVIQGIIPARRGGRGLVTRSSAIDAPYPIGTLFLAPQGSGSRSVVAGVRIATPWQLLHLHLAWIPWLLLAALIGAGKIPFLSRASEIAQDQWKRWDLAIASVISLTLFVRITPVVGLVICGLGLLFVLVHTTRLAFVRLPYPAIAFNAVVIGMAVWLLPKLVADVIEHKVARVYDQTIDHRPRKGGGDEFYSYVGQAINDDQIRFKGTAADIRTEDFNVVFMGDSFTYGALLQYGDAVPYRFEALAQGSNCSPRVRAINFGWTSSSPLLGYRQLRDIGKQYKPDLILYMLDMTDFHDDLNYERLLKNKQGMQVVQSKLFAEVFDRSILRFTDFSGLKLIKQNLRMDPLEQGEPPPDRFFATNQPLDASRPHFENGVVRNLAKIQRLAKEELNAEMILVISPRAYQYSDRESTENWERDAYTALGPHVLAPFTFFEEKEKQGLPYRVISLLPAFQRANAFPLYRSDDPHWNPAGADLVARTLLADLRDGTLPCEARKP
jgi:hypothetical protein